VEALVMAAPQAREAALVMAAPQAREAAQE
jgi:hypothetical protein